MQTTDRAIVNWVSRERAVVEEGDLERNFELSKEVAHCIWQYLLSTNWRYEIPNLSDFEAGLTMHMCVCVLNGMHYSVCMRWCT